MHACTLLPTPLVGHHTHPKRLRPCLRAATLLHCAIFLGIAHIVYASTNSDALPAHVARTALPYSTLNLYQHPAKGKLLLSSCGRRHIVNIDTTIGILHYADVQHAVLRRRTTRGIALMYNMRYCADVQHAVLRGTFKAAIKMISLISSAMTHRTALKVRDPRRQKQIPGLNTL